jgi:hypothetical protein
MALRRALRSAVAACLVLACVAFPSLANGQDLPTLTGEYLSSGTAASTTSFTCDTQGTSSFTFTASGVAFGPYPGTFTESGTVTVGPQTDEFLPGQFRGPVTSFDAQFTITSPLGTVTGTKTLAAPLTPVSNVGGCGPFGAQVIEDLDYTATITTPLGTFTDQGQSANTQFNICAVGLDCGTSPGNQGQFSEWFASQEPVTEPAFVTLSPPTAVNTAGTSHTVTATVTTAAGSPVPDATVFFTVSGSVTAAGQCTTNAQGQCDFTYGGPAFPGADLIRGCADANANNQIDPGEPCGEATKIWIVPATTPGQVTGGGWIEPATGRVSFGFNAQSDGTSVKGNCNVIDHNTMTQIKCRSVDSLVVAATHATFFGQATVDGVATNYRIDVDDNGEPGSSDTFKIQTDSGYVAAGTLQGGNIQIHH